MKMIAIAASALALAGCALPPVQMRSAPVPTDKQLAELVAVQSRDVDVEISDVFPRILAVLLDAGYVIRSANKDLGQVSFYQQWSDPEQGAANITQEGTAIFSSTGAHRTTVRVAVTGGWQRLEVTGGGPKTTDTGMVGGVQMSIPPGEYKRLLDLIEIGLKAH